jgi:hypothetical protein
MGPLSSAMGEYMKIYEYLPEKPRNVYPLNVKLVRLKQCVRAIEEFVSFALI